jgi:hypothetical protein
MQKTLGKLPRVFVTLIIKSCIPIIPIADLEKSLPFWVEGLGLTVDREMRHEGRLAGFLCGFIRLKYG